MAALVLAPSCAVLLTLSVCSELKQGPSLLQHARPADTQAQARFKPGGFEAPGEDELAALEQALGPLASEQLR